MTQCKTASELKVGDVLDDLWFAKGNRDKITMLRPYTGPVKWLRGGVIASFHESKFTVTLEPGTYTVINSIN